MVEPSAEDVAFGKKRSERKDKVHSARLTRRRAAYKETHPRDDSDEEDDSDDESSSEKDDDGDDHAKEAHDKESDNEGDSDNGQAVTEQETEEIAAGDGDNDEPDEEEVVGTDDNVQPIVIDWNQDRATQIESLFGGSVPSSSSSSAKVKVTLLET